MPHGLEDLNLPDLDRFDWRRGIERRWQFGMLRGQERARGGSHRFFHDWNVPASGIGAGRSFVMRFSYHRRVADGHRVVGAVLPYPECHRRRLVNVGDWCDIRDRDVVDWRSFDGGAVSR